MNELEDLGYVWHRKALNAEDISALNTGISWSSVSGTRDIALNADLQSTLITLVEPFLPGARIVRLTAFNKTAENNWALPWHQDRVVLARKRLDDPRFRNWTRKDGYWHCEPPIQYLENMLFARIYLDEVGADAGDIQLAKGSHKFGKIPHEDIEGVLLSRPIIQCTGQMGDVLLVKALTLHKSGKTQSATPRRALRVDFSSDVEIHGLAIF